jgi:hypothetical protein
VILIVGVFFSSSTGLLFPLWMLALSVYILRETRRAV